MGQLHLTASDVAAQFYLAPSGASDHVLDGRQDTKIVQMLYSGTPATTTTAKVYMNGQDTGIVLVGAANAPGAVNPQISPTKPLYVPAGSQLRFTQV
jgi:hypothetical protein